MNATQLGYLAGILDGEGSFSVVLYNRNDAQKRLRTEGFLYHVRITQKDRRLLDALKSWAGGRAGIWKAGKDHAYWALRFHNTFLRECLPDLIPLLILKRRQAKIILWFLNHPGRAGRKRMPKRDWDHRLKLREECLALNRH